MTLRNAFVPLFTTCFLSSTLSAQTAVGPSALKALPAKTTLVLQVDNVGGLIKKIKASPPYALKDRGEFAGLIKQFEAAVEKARNEARAETGVDLLELLDAVKGEVIFVIGDISPLARTVGDAVTNLEEPDIKPGDVPILLAWDTLSGGPKFQTGYAKLLDFMRSKGVNVETSDQDFHGAKITAIKLPEEAFEGTPASLYIGQHGSRYLLTLSRKFLEQTVTNLKPDAKGGGLLDHPPFVATQRLTAHSSDAFVYLNVKAITTAIDSALSTHMFAFFWKKLEETFIGKSLENIGYSVALEKERVRVRMLANNGGGDDGMLGWFKGEPFPANPPSVIPDDVKSVSSITLNVERAAKTIRQLAELAMSMQGQTQDLDSLFEQQFGVKLKEFISSFGDRLHFFSNPPSGSNLFGDFGIIVEMKDDASCQKFLGKLPLLLQGFVENEKYMNRDMYMVVTGEGVNPAICVTDKMLLFALQGDLVKKIIRRVGKNVPGIGDTAGYKKLASFLPARVSNLNYTSADYISGALSEAVKGAAQDTGAEVPPEILQLIDALGKTLGASIGYGVWKKEGLYFDSVLHYNK